LDLKDYRWQTVSDIGHMLLTRHPVAGSVEFLSLSLISGVFGGS